MHEHFEVGLILQAAFFRLFARHLDIGRIESDGGGWKAA